MAEKKNKSAKPFNFGDAGLLKQTEETVVKAYERIEQQEQSGGGCCNPVAAHNQHHYYRDSCNHRISRNENRP